MEHLKLTEDLLTGITEIDKQHRELFARGNAVLFPETGKMAPEDVISALEFLLQYVDEHFSAEERLMKHYEYERLEGHRKQHQRLRKDFEEIYRRSKKTDSVRGLESELYYLFSDWYVYHIMQWDQPYAVFLQKSTKLDSIMIPTITESVLSRSI